MSEGNGVLTGKALDEALNGVNLDVALSGLQAFRVHVETLQWLCREAKRSDDDIALQFVRSFLTGVLTAYEMKGFREELDGITPDSPSQDTLFLRRLRETKTEPWIQPDTSYPAPKPDAGPSVNGGTHVIPTKPLPPLPPSGKAVPLGQALRQLKAQEVKPVVGSGSVLRDLLAPNPDNGSAPQW